MKVKVEWADGAVRVYEAKTSVALWPAGSRPEIIIPVAGVKSWTVLEEGEGP